MYIYRMHTLRPMRLPDLADVLRIERASFPHPWSEASLKSSFENDAAFVCGQERVEGYCFARFAADQAEILTLAVDPALRHQGIGEALLHFLLQTAAQRGCQGVFLEVRPSNTAAQALYKKAGFKFLGRRKAYYSDGEDALILGIQSA